MIDQQFVGIIRALLIAAVGCLFIAPVKIQRCSGAGRQIGNIDPHQRNLRLLAVPLQVVVQRRLVVGRDEAKVAAIGFQVGEVEIALVQAQQNLRAANRLGDVRTGRSGIRIQFHTVLPVLVPPGLGGRCKGKHQGKQRQSLEP